MTVASSPATRRYHCIRKQSCQACLTSVCQVARTSTLTQEESLRNSLTHFPWSCPFSWCRILQWIREANDQLKRTVKRSQKTYKKMLVQWKEEIHGRYLRLRNSDEFESFNLSGPWFNPLLLSAELGNFDLFASCLWRKRIFHNIVKIYLDQSVL